METKQDAPVNEKAQPKPGPTSSFSKLGVVMLAMGGKALAIIFKIKGMASLLSMLVSVLAYWWTFNLGLAGAVLFVALLFFHEMGHLLVARYQGTKTSLPMFIPFVGALITLKEMPADAEKEAWMALGGPILGSIAALACVPIYLATGAKLWLWGASIGFMINIFNLLPLSPLDGGRIVGSIWRGFWFVGAAGLLALAWLEKDVFLLVILAIGIEDINKRLVIFKSYWWLAAGAASLGIAFCWGSWWVLIVTAYTGLIYWSANTEERRSQRRRDELKMQLASNVRLLEHFGGGALPEDQEHWRQVLLIERDAMKELLEPKPVHDAYFAVPMSKKLLIGAVYLGLAGMLGSMLVWVHSLQVFH